MLHQGPNHELCRGAGFLPCLIANWQYPPRRTSALGSSVDGLLPDRLWLSWCLSPLFILRAGGLPGRHGRAGFDSPLNLCTQGWTTTQVQASDASSTGTTAI